MVKASEVMTRLYNLNVAIKDVLKDALGKDQDLRENIQFENSADGRQIEIEMFRIIEKLEDVKCDLDYLSREIADAGVLKMNEYGKYELKKNGIELRTYSCGSTVEVLIPKKNEDADYWYTSRFEHDGSGYYIVGIKGINPEGLKARYRALK